MRSLRIMSLNGDRTAETSREGKESEEEGAFGAEAIGGGFAVDLPSDVLVLKLELALFLNRYRTAFLASRTHKPPKYFGPVFRCGFND